MKTKLLLLIVLLSSAISFAQIAEFNFDDTYSNVGNTITFGYGSGTSFVAGRKGGTDKALKINAFYTNPNATISSLPLGNSDRTISLWYKVDNNATSPTIFYYGTASSGQYFGLSLSTTGAPVFQGTGLGVGDNFGGAYSAGTWQHAVVTYEGASSTVRVYMNGELLNSISKTLNTVGNVFRLISYDTGKEYDDLKIYDRALTALEISNLYDYNTIVAPITKPSISYNISPTTTTSATINYYINANNAATTSIIKYGLSETSLTSQVTGISTTGKTYAVGNTIISGLLPNTQYFYQIEATNSAGTNSSIILNFTTVVAPVLKAPTITAVSSSLITSYSANIAYTLNANNEATTSVINYGVLNGALTSQKIGFSATGNTALSSAIMLSGLNASTIYYYQIAATNATGSTTSPVESFTTTAAPLPGQLITEYNFDNTYNNINGNSPFGSNTETSFVTGRDGVTANGALNINNSGSIATITGLPYGNAARTVSLWVKTNIMNSGYNMIFSYGQGSNSKAFGASYNSNLCEMFGYSKNLSIASTNTNNIWYHFVYTYDGTNAKIYKNGVLLTTVPKTWNTGNTSDIFKLGIGVGNEFSFNGAIDDLKIYNYALADGEVSQLFTNNTLSSESFNHNNLEVSLYPNPVKDILHIETAGEIKSVTVYGILGNQVMKSTTNNVNISKLSKGMYMIRIQDVNNKISTRKIIKE